MRVCCVCDRDREAFLLAPEREWWPSKASAVTVTAAGWGSIAIAAWPDRGKDAPATSEVHRISIGGVVFGVVVWLSPSFEVNSCMIGMEWSSICGGTMRPCMVCAMGAGD